MTMPDDLCDEIAEMRRRRETIARDGAIAFKPFRDQCVHLAPRLADEVDRLREALQTLAQWQVERRPGGSGEMCDFADAAMKGGDQR